MGRFPWTSLSYSLSFPSARKYCWDCDKTRQADLFTCDLFARESNATFQMHV